MKPGHDELLKLADALATAVREWSATTLDHGCGFHIHDHIRLCIEPRIDAMLAAMRAYDQARGRTA